MVAFPDITRLTYLPVFPASSPARASGHAGVPVATAGALLAAALAAACCLLVPADRLAALVEASGIAALVPAAEPPLGVFARVLLAAGGGVLAGAVGWAVLVLAGGERTVALPSPLQLWRGAGRARGPLAVRRADSHPDAPPRPPIRAERDLGVPFLSIVAAPAGPAADPAADERDVPDDLDIVLSRVDPASIPAVPREPVRALPSLAPARPHPVPLAPGERIETVELGADVRDRPDSIEALLARLERGARRRPVAAAASPVRAAAPEGRSLEETLMSLRQLAGRR